MSSVSGVDSNFGFEALAVAMSKRQSDANGQVALDLVQSTVANVQQVNAQAAAAAPQGSLGHNINVYA